MLNDPSIQAFTNQFPAKIRRSPRHETNSLPCFLPFRLDLSWTELGHPLAGKSDTPLAQFKHTSLTLFNPFSIAHLLVSWV